MHTTHDTHDDTHTTHERVTMHTHAFVFVYGTLKQGYGNWAWALNRTPVIPAARLRGYALRALPAYPCAVPHVSGFVWGEVYRCTRTDIRTLDNLEGHPHLYRRIRVSLDVPGHDMPCRAFTYVMPHDAHTHAPLIPSGVWTPETGRRELMLAGFDTTRPDDMRRVWGDDDTYDDAHDDDACEPWYDCAHDCLSCDPSVSCVCPRAFDWLRPESATHDAHDDACDPPCMRSDDALDCTTCDDDACAFRIYDSQRSEFDTTHDDDVPTYPACDLRCETCPRDACPFATYDDAHDDTTTCACCREARADGWGDMCATCRATLRVNATT